MNFTKHLPILPPSLHSHGLYPDLTPHFLGPGWRPKEPYPCPTLAIPLPLSNYLCNTFMSLSWAEQWFPQTIPLWGFGIPSTCEWECWGSGHTTSKNVNLACWRFSVKGTGDQAGVGRTLWSSPETGYKTLRWEVLSLYPEERGTLIPKMKEHPQQYEWLGLAKFPPVFHSEAPLPCLGLPWFSSLHQIWYKDSRVEPLLWVFISLKASTSHKTWSK